MCKLLGLSVKLWLVRAEATLKLRLLLLLGSANQIIERVHTLRPLRLVGLHSHGHVSSHAHAHSHVHLIHLAGHGLEAALAHHRLETSLHLLLLLLLCRLLVLLVHESAEGVLPRQVLLSGKWISLGGWLLSRLRWLLLRVELIQDVHAAVRLEWLRLLGCCRLLLRCGVHGEYVIESVVR